MRRGTTFSDLEQVDSSVCARELKVRTVPRLCEQQHEIFRGCLMGSAGPCEVEKQLQHESLL
jgi:hypothetical protein